jgi:Flp pilus assembly protein TadB
MDMKTSKLFSMLVVAFTCLFSYNVSFATAAVSAKETRETILKKVATGDADALLDQFTKTKAGKKAEKWMKKISKKFDGAKLDFSSEPDKWLKYSLIAAAVSIVLSIVGLFSLIIGLLSWLFWLCAVVLFFYWLFLKLEII